MEKFSLKGEKIMSVTPILIYMTAADKVEAVKISQALLEEKLVACANIMAPHTALYRWESQVKRSEEVAVIFKTRADLFDRARDIITARHSYDCPCVVALPITDGHQPFLDWIAAETDA